jgi:hypothetical protein
MEVLVVMFLLALPVLAILAARFGADSRPSIEDTRPNWW